MLKKALIVLFVVVLLAVSAGAVSATPGDITIEGVTPNSFVVNEQMVVQVTATNNTGSSITCNRMVQVYKGATRLSSNGSAMIMPAGQTVTTPATLSTHPSQIGEDYRVVVSFSGANAVCGETTTQSFPVKVVASQVFLPLVVR